VNKQPHPAPLPTAILARFFRPSPVRFVCVLLALLGGPKTAPAVEPREQAEAVLMPFLDVLASPPAGEARAFRVQGRLESLNAPTASLQPGQTQAVPLTFDFALHPPGRMRLSFPSAGGQITACRNGQRAWISPAEAIRPLLEQLPPAQKQRSMQFPPIELPFSGRQLALLPALLEVQDKGTSPLDGAPCRILDVRMQPEIGSLMPAEAKGWALRLWVNPAGRPARAGIQGPGTSAVLRFDSVQFSAQLPAGLWEVPADSAPVTPAQFDALVAMLLQHSKQR
jgi:hypothetical protein